MALGAVSCGNNDRQENTRPVAGTPEEVVKYYSGRLGETDIVMKLNFSGEEIKSGHYYYLSQCEPIWLTDAKTENGKFIFSEIIENGNKTGSVELVPEKGKKEITGSWHNPSGNKSIEIKAKEFEPRIDKYKIEQHRYEYSKPDDYHYGFYTTRIVLIDSTGKNSEEILVHEKMYGKTWVELDQLMKEAAESEDDDNMYQGLTSFWDTIYNDNYDLLTVYSSFCEFAAREHCNEEYELFDLQEKKFIKGEDYLRKDNYEEFKKAFLKKLNVLIDKMITELKAEEMPEEDLGYMPDMVIEFLEMDKEELADYHLTSLTPEHNKVVFIYDFGLFFMPVELYVPEDRIEFSAKEIAPFINPEGPLNYLLLGFFERKILE